MRSRFSIVISMVVLLAGCKEFTPEKQAIVILVDRTDNVIPKPILEDIQSVIDIKSNSNIGVDINYQHIGETDFNKDYRLSLPWVSILENTHQRTSDVKGFYKQLDSLFSYENSKSYHYKSSSVLFPLLRQIEGLESSTANHKIILLYSDLSEISDIYDSYGQIQLLMNNPQQVAIELASQLEIPKTSNTTLYIIFEPKTKEQNRLFRSWVQIYQQLFKGSGITIIVGLQKQWNYG